METAAKLAGFAAFAAGATLAASGWAQHSVEYGLNLSLGKDGFFEHYEVGDNPGAPVEHTIEQPGYGRISGVANVGFGVNKARIDLTGTNAANPLIGEVGFASSQYFDRFQFDDPDLNGQHGFFEATLFVAGSGFTQLSQSFIDSPDTMFDAFWHAGIN